jgi:hypothetical protein
MNFIKTSVAIAFIAFPVSANNTTDKFITTIRQQTEASVIFATLGIMNFVTDKCIGKNKPYMFANDSLAVASLLSRHSDFVASMTKGEYYIMQTAKDKVEKLYSTVSPEVFCATSIVTFDFLAIKT